MAKVKALILRAPGTNCDVETAFAFEQAGAAAIEVHINQLIRGERQLFDFQVLVIPGGFTYGDDVAAGKVLANELSARLGGDIQRFIESGGLILGICNGFQVLARAGFLPGITDVGARFTLVGNDSGRFECRWVYLKADSKSPCIFTRGIERIYLPVAHGEGKLVATPQVLSHLNAVLYYTDEQGNTNAGYPFNPNGSLNDIAGVCDASGRVFGLMPHPERYIRGTQHPRWTRLGAPERGDGFRIFSNAVSWARAL